MSRLSLRLRVLRRRHSLTQKQLAERLSITPQYLNDMEKGRRSLTPEKVGTLLLAFPDEQPLQWNRDGAKDRGWKI